MALSLCLPFCPPSVTCWRSIKTAERRTKQTSPHDNPETLIFEVNVLDEIPVEQRPTRAPSVRRVENICDFRQLTRYISKTVQDIHMHFMGQLDLYRP